MSDITQAPWWYIGFTALHLLLGQYGSAAIYRLRFGQSPLVLYKKDNQGEHQKITRWMALPTLIWAGSMIAFAFLDEYRSFALGQPLIELPVWLGWIVASVGLLGMLAAQYAMGDAWRVGQDESGQTQQKLVTTGFFQYSRNAIYVFSFMYLLGATLWTPCVISIVSLAGIGALMHGLVLAEEAYLAETFGQAWEDYRRRVRRYL